MGYHDLCPFRTILVESWNWECTFFAASQWYDRSSDHISGLVFLGHIFPSWHQREVFLIELQEAPQSHPSHWKFLHLAGPVHIFMRNLCVSAMLRVFDFPAALAPLTPFNLGHPVTAGQKENGHSISKGIKSLDKKADHHQCLIPGLKPRNINVKQSKNTCWNKQKREHEATWYTAACRPANLRARLKEDLAEMDTSLVSARRQIPCSSKKDFRKEQMGLSENRVYSQL